MQDCNQPHCILANVIKFQHANHNKWIIAIAPEHDNGTFSITFGSNCIANCTNATHGTCGDGVSTGLCLCRYGWTGLACEQEAGFNRAYLVLLIIGGIIVAAGTISLVVSCFTKPSSPDYQTL